jgi:predicted aldo/keto reductase-like oxidoreductase
MQYRKFGNLDWKVSALGLGCMRLPTKGGGSNPMSGDIEENRAIGMIRYAIDRGVNYLDTAYTYHGGNSEVLLGKALKDGYRERVRIATKSPVWRIKKPEDFDAMLNEQLERLQTNQIDFYLLHSLRRKTWNEYVLKYDLLSKAEEAKKDGRIKYIGFSFHDDYDCFKTIVDGYDKWDFCQIQYNYLDTENQAGTKGLKYAASKGLPVVIMEPLLGGKLARPPKSIREIIDEYFIKRSPVDWALQWLWNQPEVSVVLSGMSDLDQIKENIGYAGQSGINTLGEKEHDLIKKIVERYKGRIAVPCTACNYCMPCPNSVDIPSIFEIYNSSSMHEDIDGARNLYLRNINEENRADKCIQCRICEEKCPQKISISEWMPKAQELLG